MQLPQASVSEPESGSGAYGVMAWVTTVPPALG